MRGSYSPKQKGKGKKKDKIRAVFLGYDDDDVIVRYIREDDTESVFPLPHSLIVYQTQRGAKEERCLGGKREKKKEEKRIIKWVVEDRILCGRKKKEMREYWKLPLHSSLFFSFLFLWLVKVEFVCLMKDRKTDYLLQR